MIETGSDARYTKLSDLERNQEAQVRESKISSPERQDDSFRSGSVDSLSSYSVEMLHSNS